MNPAVFEIVQKRFHILKDLIKTSTNERIYSFEGLPESRISMVTDPIALQLVYTWNNALLKVENSERDHAELVLTKILNGRYVAWVQISRNGEIRVLKDAVLDEPSADQIMAVFAMTSAFTDEHGWLW